MTDPKAGQDDRVLGQFRDSPWLIGALALSSADRAVRRIGAFWRGPGDPGTGTGQDGLLTKLTFVSGQRIYNYAIREFATLLLFGASDGRRSTGSLPISTAGLAIWCALSGFRLG